MPQDTAPATSLTDGKAESRPAMRSTEFRCLIALLIALSALLGFVTFTGEVIEGDTTAFDRRILLSLRVPGDLATPIGPPWLAKVAGDITALGGPAVLTLFTVLLTIYLLITRRFREAALVTIAIGGGTILSTLLKTAIDRPRPDLLPNVVATMSASFPSGHAMLSAVTYLTVGGLLMRLQPSRTAKIYVFAVAVLLTILIGLSRIFLAVHWPTDVLGGWCGGAIWALLCWLTATWLQRSQVITTA